MQSRMISVISIAIVGLVAIAVSFGNRAAGVAQVERAAPNASVTLNSNADATVLEGYPAVKFGASIDMWAGYDNCLPDSGSSQSLVEFDLASIPTNQTVITATLRLNIVNSCDSPGASAIIKTHRTTEDWTEDAVVWNRKPGYTGEYGAQAISHEDKGWYEFDVTELVRAWQDGTYANHGITLTGPASGRRSFSTREGNFSPQLVIGLTMPTITGTPTPTNTDPPTPINTPTPVDTDTPTPTNTPTPVDTNTPTPTETPTAIVSPTPTATRDMTVTPKPTMTPSTSGIYLPIVVNHP